MKDYGYLSLLIRGDKINHENILNNTFMSPTSFSNKNDMLDEDKTDKIIDSIVYSIKFDNLNELENTSISFLDTLTKSKEFIWELSKEFHVEITYSIYTDFSSTGFIIPKDIINKIAEFHVGLYVSYFSFQLNDDILTLLNQS